MFQFTMGFITALAFILAGIVVLHIDHRKRINKLIREFQKEYGNEQN